MNFSPVSMLHCFGFTDSEGIGYLNQRPSEAKSPILEIHIDVPGLRVFYPIPNEHVFNYYEGSVYFMGEGAPGGDMKSSVCWKMLTYYKDTPRVWGTSVDLLGVVRAGWTDEGEALDWNKVNRNALGSKAG